MRAINRIACALIACALLQGVLYAEPATKPVVRPPIPKDETARDAAIRQTKVLDLLDFEAAVELFEFSGEDETKLVRLECEFSFAIGRLEHVVLAKFGQSFDDDFIHAAGGKTEAELRSADVRVDGDHAAVFYKGDQTPSLNLVRVNGVWKIDTHELTAGMSAAERSNYVRILSAIRDEMPKIGRDLHAGKLRTGEDVITAVKATMERIVNQAEPGR